MTDKTLPPFIFNPGQNAYQGPFKHDDSHIFAFFVKGELDKIQRNVDMSLNQLGEQNFHFVAVTDLVMVQFARLNEVYSLAPGFIDKGKIRETDVITWVLLAQCDQQQQIITTFWHPVHIWVDNVHAISTGREIYGYPKQLAIATMADHLNQPLAFDLQVFDHKTQGRELFPTQDTLLQINDKSMQPATDMSITGFGAQFAKLLLQHGEQADFTLGQSAKLMSSMLNSDINQVFLKQFPDASGKRAVYQALVSTCSRVDKVHSVKQFTPSQFELTLHQHDALPLNQTLGLSIGTQPVLFAIYLHVDFTTNIGKELSSNNSNKKQKIAVIGGGIGSLTTVFNLTEQPNWQQNYDITLYQMGWRLGGKGASGRNAKYHQRIEEHGLHVWFGCYHNSFAMMKKLYQHLDRPPEHPHQQLSDAFKPQHYTGLTEMVGDQYSTTNIRHTERPGELGEGEHQITAYQSFLSTIDMLDTSLQLYLTKEQEQNNSAMLKTSEVVLGALSALSPKITTNLPKFLPDIQNMLKGLHHFLAGLSHSKNPLARAQLNALKPMLNTIRRLINSRMLPKAATNHEWRVMYVNIDLSLSMVKGMLQDEIFKQGFDVINHMDFRQWLKKHGANEQYTLQGAQVMGLYNLVFAYVDGDTNQPNVEAGTMLRAVLRMKTGYNGAFMYEMQGGMGDVVFEPLYSVLKARGVKFEFFSQVESLTGENNQVEKMMVINQLGQSMDYDPLVNIKGMDCWPSEPNYQGLEQAELLAQHYQDLETNPQRWQQTYQQHTGQELPRQELTRGKDFDIVVFGAALPSLPIIASDLLTQDSNMAKMASKIKSNATQAFQTFTPESLPQMGWEHSENPNPITSGLLRPFDTWSAMDHLIRFEDWQTSPIQAINYHCCVLPVTQSSSQQVKDNAISFMHGPFKQLLPQFNPEAIANDSSRSYYRANHYGSERYVVSHVGTSKYRLAPDGSCFNNLILTGDWTRNGMNIGCIEAAVTSGMMASRAICGQPFEIEGEKDT